MRFDHLQRLVGECRAVDGDLFPHAPRGMLERLFRSCPPERFERPIAKRSARRSEHHATNVLVTASSDALQDSAMLAVHWDDLSTAAPDCLANEMARHDQRFLVRERH